MRPADTLRRHMELGSTGTVTVCLSEARTISVYLMQGEILAAETPEDGLAVLSRLENSDALGAETAAALRERLLRAGRVGDVLFGAVSDDLLMDLFARRFRENLARFLSAEGAVAFTERETIHVENVQVGHDSGELLAELCAQLEAVAALMSPAVPVVLAEGDGSPSTSRQARVLEALPPDGSLERLLLASPFEPLETLTHVVALLGSGALVRGDVGDVGGEPQALAGCPGGAEEGAEEASVETGELEEGAVLGDPEVDDDAGPVVVDRPEEGDDLSMFRDHDRRQRAGDGTFSVARELLDRVDLSGFSLFDDLVPGDDQVLEMEDGDKVDAAAGAVNLCFTSPPLGHEDAIKKVEVTNEVLRQICRALDDEHGSGSGQAAALLLVESCPVEYAAIFAGIEPGRDGAIDAARAVCNLEARPESERRRLLNGALRDLVERGFAVSVERLGEERLEVMLERIAGFQQRLGL